jgi:hypothetical protein
MALRARQTRRGERREPSEPRLRPAVRELLDHLARELAAEYLRLRREPPAQKGERS